MFVSDVQVSLGGAVDLTVTFPSDPSTLTLELKSPAGAVTSYTYGAAQITRVSAGVFSKTLAASVLNAPGMWYYSWIGTGLEGVVQGAIEVLARRSAA